MIKLSVEAFVKWLQKGNWEALSIARGASKGYVLSLRVLSPCDADPTVVRRNPAASD